MVGEIVRFKGMFCGDFDRESAILKCCKLSSPPIQTREIEKREDKEQSRL